MRSVSILAAALMCLSMQALAAPVSSNHFGVWGPSNNPCGEPRVEIQKDFVRLTHHGKTEMFGNLEEDLTCWSGASRDSISSCIVLDFNGKDPNRPKFELTMNPDEKKGLARFEVDKRSAKFYPYDKLVLKRCSKI